MAGTIFWAIQGRWAKDFVKTNWEAVLKHQQKNDGKDTTLVFDRF